MQSLAEELVGEALGVFVIVLTGSLALARWGSSSPAAVVAVSGAFAAGLAAALAAVAGGRSRPLNPALAFGELLDRRISVARLLRAWVAQIAGALLASAAVWAIAGRAAVERSVTSSDDLVAGFVSEVVFTAIFAIAYFASSGSTSALERHLALVAVYFAAHLAALPISGSSVNPARSLGPALLTGRTGQLWLYLTAPMLGAVLATGIHRVLRTPGGDDPAT